MGEGRRLPLPAPHPMSIVKRTPLEQGLEELSNALSADLAPPDLATLFDRVKEAQEVVEHLHKMVRDRVIQVVVQKQNREKAEAFKMTAGDYVLEVRRRSSIDPARLEGLVRSKGLNPAEYMTTEVKYKVKPEGVDALLHQGHLSLEELESCRPADSYTVMSPKRVNDE